MDSEECIDIVKCPTCRGSGKVSLNDPILNRNEQNENYKFEETKEFVHTRNQQNGNLASDFKHLKLLTGMDTIIGYVADLLPEKAPLDNPKEVIKLILIRIKNTNLEEHKRAIVDAVQVAQYHQILLKPHLNLINQKIIHFLNSQRILYVRLACQSAGELFRILRCTDRPALCKMSKITRAVYIICTLPKYYVYYDAKNRIENIVKIFDCIVIGLMYRTADKNQNIRIDANWALDKMVISIPPLFAIRAITNCHHKNSAVRITQLRLMHCITVIADPIKILTGTALKEVRKLILKTCIATIENPNADIRFMSKKLMQLLKNTCYERFCSSLVQDFSRDELKIVEKNLNVEDLTVVLKKNVN